MCVCLSLLSHLGIHTPCVCECGTRGLLLFADGLPVCNEVGQPGEMLSADAESAAGFTQLCNLWKLWLSICNSRSQQITGIERYSTSINIVLFMQGSCVSAATGSHSEPSTSICTSYCVIFREQWSLIITQCWLHLYVILCIRSSQSASQLRTKDRKTDNICVVGVRGEPWLLIRPCISKESVVV